MSFAIKEVLESYRRISIAGLVKDYLKRITTFHRIQGSKGLEKAVKHTSELLENLGLNTKIFHVPSSSIKGFMETPVSWNATGARLEFKKDESVIARYEYEEHPTIVAAHSPPGEGCSELKYCPSIEGCSGSAVMVESPAFIAYHEIDADLIILFDSKRYPEAVPYTGLFIRKDELKSKPTVMNIPYALAQRLISLLSKGVKVTVCWKVTAEYSDEPLLGLVAYSGEDPGILFVSHICHPKPGAHDNASGTAANIAVAKILSRSIPTYPHAHLVIPEYSGTIYAKEHLPWTPRGVVNLDMVGSKQSVTGSVLNLVNPPLFMKPVSAAYSYIATKLLLDEASSFGGFSLPAYRYSITPYTTGSDHDVTIVWGIDSVMLNEWPSKYYHTDMDDVDTLSTQYLSSTAIIAALTGYMVQNGVLGGQIVEYYREYLKSWYMFEAVKKGIDVSRVSRALEYWNKLEKVRGPETPISARLIYRLLGYQAYSRLREIKGALTYLSVYAPLAHMSGLREYKELFQAENLLVWKKEEEKYVDEAWSLIVDKLR